MQAKCPECGYEFVMPIAFENDVFMDDEGPGVLVDCPRCRAMFDAAAPTSQGPGVYSTVGGRLVRVRELLEQVQAGTAPESVDELAAEIERADPILAPLAEWVRQHGPGLAKFIVASVVSGVIGAYIALLISGPAVTRDDIEELVERSEQESRDDPERQRGEREHQGNPPEFGGGDRRDQRGAGEEESERGSDAERDRSGRSD